MEERFLVTGATGCIGAWTVRNLIRDGVYVGVLVRGDDRHRLRLIMGEDEISRVRFIKGDITDLEVIRSAVAEHGITHIVHLAAMQLPFCKADPPLGAAVNVQGTVNIFEAAKSGGIRHVVYASSTAVYGPRDRYPAGPLMHDAPLDPRSHYGVYKQANEATARGLLAGRRHLERRHPALRRLRSRQGSGDDVHTDEGDAGGCGR